MRILLSDAETPAALAAARSLDRAGHRVFVLAHSRHAAAAASRHARAVPVPDAVRDPEKWTEALLAHLRRVRREVFVPVTDTAILLASAVRAELEAVTRVALSPPEALDVLVSKVAVLDRAAALGIPVLPRHEGVSAESAPLPAVVKPLGSRALGRKGVAGATAAVVGTKQELRDRVRGLAAAGLGAYTEPWVAGVGHGIFLLIHEGRVLARFAHRRVREASPLGGPSAVAESVAAAPALVDHAERLARDIGAEGPFMAEFRGDDEDGVLLEVNARYWGSLALAIDAGVDFPALHVAALSGRPRPGPGTWETGVRRRNLSFDVRHALRALRGRPRELPIPWPGRIRPAVRLLTERVPGMIHRKDDRAAGRAHLVGLVKKGVGRA